MVRTVLSAVGALSCTGTDARLETLVTGQSLPNLPSMQLAAKRNVLFALLVGQARTSHWGEPDASQSTKVLPFVVFLHLGIELRIEEKGDEPAGKFHLAVEPGVEAVMTDSSTADVPANEKEFRFSM